jgi:hypothetical protein
MRTARIADENEAARMKSWNRKLWGVLFTGKDESFLLNETMLVGSLWNSEAVESYPGSPTRALLFCTMKAAREWCRTTNALWEQYDNGIVENWRVQPVRVSEVVKEAKF